jgi:hypothetical protein
VATLVEATLYKTLNPNIEIRNLDKAEKKKISYHEITKGRNYEKDHETFRFFQMSCFRDSFHVFAMNSIAQNKEITLNKIKNEPPL